MTRAYLCVTIDCECDKGPKWRVGWPLTFRGVTDGIAGRLAPLFAARRAEPTYLISPELLGHEPSVALLGRMPGELGAHLHGELAEPGSRRVDVTAEVQRDYPEAVERAKLTWLTDRFAACFGRKPVSFRAGRFGIGEHTLPLLAGLGYRVDSSVTPGVPRRHFGFPAAPRQPYRPTGDDPGRSGTSPLWEVPVTIVPAHLPLAAPRWLRPTRATPDSIVSVAAQALAEAQRAQPSRPAVLCAMLHNVEVVPRASPYAQDEAAAGRILDALDALLVFAQREGIACVGLGRVPDILGA